MEEKTIRSLLSTFQLLGIGSLIMYGNSNKAAIFTINSHEVSVEDEPPQVLIRKPKAVTFAQLLKFFPNEDEEEDEENEKLEQNEPSIQAPLFAMEFTAREWDEYIVLLQPKLKRSLRVHFVHGSSPKEFYVRIDEPSYVNLCYTIQTATKNFKERIGMNHIPKLPRPGVVYAALQPSYSKAQYFRARVLSVKNRDHIEVHYIDEGKTGTCKLEHIMFLDYSVHDYEIHILKCEVRDYEVHKDYFNHPEISFQALVAKGSQLKIRTFSDSKNFVLRPDGLKYQAILVDLSIGDEGESLFKKLIMKW